MGVGLAHSLIDHIRQAHFGIPLYLHTHFDKHSDNAGILTDRPMAHGAHTRINQNLRHCILGRLRFFAIIGFFNRFDKIGGMIIGNILQSICNTLNNILLANNSHY